MLIDRNEQGVSNVAHMLASDIYTFYIYYIPLFIHIIIIYHFGDFWIFFELWGWNRPYISGEYYDDGMWWMDVFDRFFLNL